MPAQGRTGGDVELWDASVGVRGKFAIGAGQWSAPYYVNVGAGSSDLTWQAMFGVSYACGWGELRMVSRHLEFNQGGNQFLQRLDLTGPAIGARFRF